LAEFAGHQERALDPGLVHLLEHLLERDGADVLLRPPDLLGYALDSFVSGHRPQATWSPSGPRSSPCGPAG
jgi:hypothetical protein